MKLNLKKITRTFGLTLLLGLSNIGYAATTYSGKHDSASCTQITGWAWDSTQPTTPITVDIYDGSSKLTTLTADVFRQSLLDGGKGDGKHAFIFPTPASLRDGVAHSITIMIGGTQQKLTSSPKSITCGALYNIQSDHLGTPRAVVDQNNKVVWRNEGEPFGNSLPEQDVDADGKPFVLNLRFPGQYYDSETGRNQNFFRDYNTETGRYVQSDPIGLRGGVNTFAYVSGNPVSSIDPEGLMGLALPGLGGLGLGGAAAGGHSGLGRRDELGNPTGAGSALAKQLSDLVTKKTNDDCTSKDNKKPNCRKASPWDLAQAGITDEHEYKDEHGARPWSRYDICKCNDGSIRIAPVGKCGKTQDFWE